MIGPNGRGYFFAYLVPEFLADKEEPDLQRIVTATDLYDVAPPVVTGSADFAVNGGPLNGRLTSSQGRERPGNFGFGAIPGPTATATTPRPTFTTPPRPVRPPPPRPVTAAPLPTIRMGANGSVEGAGPQHVNGVSKSADAANDAKVRAYRQNVPW